MKIYKDIRKLKALTEMMFLAEQAKLARLVTRQTKLINQFNDLQTAKRQPLENGAALQAGASLRWHKWIDQRLDIMNRELAQLRVLKSSQLERIAQAYGKDVAVSGVGKKIAQQTKILNQRRNDQIS